jgi:hypothetical protein
MDTAQAMSERLEEIEMADEMMVVIRFGGSADELLPRYLGAVKRWREDEATKHFAPPLMAVHMKTEDGLLVMNLWANDEDHRNFGLKVGPHLQAEGITRPWVEHFPVAQLGWEGSVGAAGLKE